MADLPLVTSKTSTAPPEFKLTPKHKLPLGEAGGTFFLTIDGQKVCDYVGWGFSSCSVAFLQNFKSYPRDFSIKDCPTNWEVLERNHQALFDWLYEHGCDNWKPREFLMALSPSQVRLLPKLLSHSCVREVDWWKNKSHGGNKISLFRISLMKDFR